MIAIIRIAGMVKVSKGVESTLDRLRLRRKYSCVIVDENKETKGMIERVRSSVAYGKIDDKTLIELVEERGQMLEKGKKIDAKEISEKIMKNKTMKDLEIKPFFRLHPARKGINTKQHFPNGVLGNNKEKINDLIRRML